MKRSKQAATILLAVLFILSLYFQGKGSEGAPVVSLWNTMARSMEREAPVFSDLLDSFKQHPPGTVLDQRRLALYEKAIREHELQTELLIKMKRAEFGEAVSEDDSPPVEQVARR